ncbi:CSLREA domain-containing protein [Brasilonema bromeliae]|uniref:Right handed beta helix domain-containing protein n=1 Tax=Brasilonema bromeliae SPC951 TaxID=385972 RepID=A0ABX1P6A0_9CYAN|nr:CSLREA domain-containing protein [Brasilonema bromeliae]NMG19052.1 hypothetical protein [Brasilonema bromeliae SPC951]
MDLSFPGSTTENQSPLFAPLTPVFSDNVLDVLGVSTFHKSPSAIFTVNSTADVVDDSDGVTTLREAINQANADDGQDLIVFERSLFSNAQTITLSLGELDITHNLDIIAPRDLLTGGNLVTVSGNNASRVFEIETGASVNLSGLIIADGSVTGDNGAGIKNSGNLTLDNSIVRNNSAFSILVPAYKSYTLSAGLGGGIYNYRGNLEVNNSTIIGNSARDGGGIYNELGISTVNNSTINGNSAKYNGGGITNYGTGTVNNSTITGNSAGASGGGIRTSNSIVMFSKTGEQLNRTSMVVSNSTITGNSAKASDGGGICNQFGDTTLTVSNSTINGNSAGGKGGGIYNDNDFGSGNSNSNNTVSNSTINGNSAGDKGGGIYNGGPGTLEKDNTSITVNNSTVSGNTAGNNGGGIYNNHALTLLFSTITLNQAADGGGVFNSLYPTPYTTTIPTGVATVHNTIIAANTPTAKGVNRDVAGPFTSNGYNLIGDSTGSTGFGSTGDIVGTSDNPIDPRLAVLDFNGGSTATHALFPDSPAIDAADPTVLDTDPTTDQRGKPRVSSSTDIGAFEFA